MTSTTASLISFGCIFGGSLTGIVLRSALPERYFTNEEKDVLRLGFGLITTLNALVLGLLISTAKSSYDAKSSQLTQVATDVILVDRSLELYGSETSNARRALRNQVAALDDSIHLLGASSSKLQPSSSEAELSDFYHMVRRLSPRDDSQRALKAEVLRISLEVGQIRATALAAAEQFDTDTVSGGSRVLAYCLIRWLRAFCVAKPRRGDGIVRMCPYGLHCSFSDSRYGSAS
jgi:hypothetical protein